MWTLQEEFSPIEIGKSSQFRNLKLFPLIRREVNKAGLDYLLLEDGIAQGKVRVTELSGGGSVPELSIINVGRAAKPAGGRRGTSRSQAEPGSESEHPRTGKTDDGHPGILC